MARVTGIKRSLCEELLDGRASVDGSPVQVSQNYNASYTVTSVQDKETVDYKKYGGHSYATEAYLSKCATPVEIKALELAGGDVKEMMVRSSYRKTLISHDIVRAPTLVLEATGRNRQGTEIIYVEDIAAIEEERGELEKYPLVNFVRDMLSDRDCVTLLGLAGIRASRAEAKVVAFGGEVDVPTLVNGSIPYAEARAARARAGGKVMMIRYPVRF
jgi:hypothetical protein